ncbi:hypothetical protein ACTFIZ_011080 [Dictyostelium cf. discoideum]
MGLRFPCAGELSEFYQNLLTKKDCIIECPNERMTEKFFKYHDIDNHGGYLDYENWKCYDPLFFGTSIPDRKINQVYLGDKISVSISENFKEKESFFDNDNFLNTTIIDSCFHGGFVIDQDNNIGKVFMDEITNFRLFSNNIPKSRDEVNKLFYICEVISKNENSILFKVEALLEDGSTIFEVCSSFNTNKKINDKIRIQDHRYKYSCTWQLKNSMFGELSKNSIECSEIIRGYSNSIPASNIIAFFYFKFLKIYETNLTLKVIEESSNNEIIEKYLQDKTDIIKKRIFTNVLYIIRNFKELIVSNYSENECHDYLKQFYGNPSFLISFGIMGPLFLISQLLNKDPSQITNQIIFPRVGECEDANFLKSFSEIKSQYEFLGNQFLRDYIYKVHPKKLNTILCDTVKKMIYPLINEKIIFKIVEFGGGSCGLTVLFLKTLNDMLEENPNHQIKIHYCYSDISSAFIPDAVNQLKIFKNINISYKVYDLDKSLIKQGLNQSSVDMVIMQFVLHAVKDIEYSIDQIIGCKILNPKVILIFEEVSKDDQIIGSFFANFPQWNSYNDQIRTDHCCLNINEWYDLLIKVGFTKCIQFSKDINKNGPDPFIINAQKHSIKHYKPINNKYNQIIFYGCENQDNQEFINHLYEQYSIISNSIIKIKSIDQLISLDTNFTEENSNNIIIFVKGLQPLTETNFEDANFEFTKISEFVLKNAHSFKLLSLTSIYFF